MQIIKDKQIIEDTWSYIEDDAELKAGDVCVSLTRWKKDKLQLLQHAGKIGVRIAPADSVADLADDLKDIQLIDLNFPSFGDGRAFSNAWLLRGRYHYSGEIRASGQCMPDQVYYLSRVGVNAFNFAKEEDLPVALTALNDFTVNYQKSIN